MILINLLPPGMRKTSSLHPFFGDPRKIAKWGGAAFLMLTILFYFQYQFSLKNLKGLQTRWQSLEKDVQRVSELQRNLEGGAGGEKKFLDSYVTSPLAVTTILNAVSGLLPDSIWLLELKVSRQPKENTFLVKGFSLAFNRQSSIQDIERYLQAMKEKFPPKTELILTTSRQTKENRELTLFTAVFKWP